jgi:putative ATPase
MKDLGMGQNYRYAHDEPEGYAAGENYFPDEMQPQNYYQPVARGLEIKIKERLDYLKKLK